MLSTGGLQRGKAERRTHRSLLCSSPTTLHTGVPNLHYYTQQTLTVTHGVLFKPNTAQHKNYLNTTLGKVSYV